jgi:aspartyl-tRNA(Asn)/glutamyl-tRNA(Gln) amidotransferase subunit A
LDERDSTSVDRAVPDYTATLNDSIAGLRIGLPKEFFAEGLNPQVAEVIEKAVKEFEAKGAIIKEVTLPNSHLAVPVYYVVAPAECSSNLARFDGVRFGHRCSNPQDLKDLYERSRWEGFGAEVKRRIMAGTFVLSHGYYDAYYTKGQKVRRVLKDKTDELFNQFDAVILPTTPSTAFELNAVSDPIQMYLQDIFTVHANLTGNPAISLPIGHHSNGLPFGIQVMTAQFEEKKLINVSAELIKCVNE